MPAALLIYDANCPMCTRAQAWIARHAQPGALEYLGCQSDERARRVPQMSEEECMEAMQLVLEDGRIFAATAAFERLLPRLRGPWRHLALLFRVPGVRSLAPLAYRVIARNRMTLSGLLARKAPGEHCDLNKGCR